MTTKETASLILDIAKEAKTAATRMASASVVTKDKALNAIAKCLLDHENDILEANQKDITLAEEQKRPRAMIDRLLLNAHRIKAMADGIQHVIDLPDPVGKTLDQIIRPNGLNIQKISVPLGVVGVIYESRPNVTADAAALCIKSGNAAILRGGSESFHSSLAIMNCIEKGLEAVRLPKSVIQMIPTPDRTAVDEMIKLHEYIDILIPRGGQPLIQKLIEESKIPLFQHLTGLCHTYIHHDAEIDMAVDVTLNAKMRRTGICGATETILIDKDILITHLKPMVDALIQKGCEIRGDECAANFDPRIKLAKQDDWSTEYLDAIVSIACIGGLEDAITHINEFGSHHTDAIITEDIGAAREFMKCVDSAIVMHNASTQFADGGEFGMGAEIGIATGKLHARGPVGAQQLTTFKYQVWGDGQTRS